MSPTTSVTIRVMQPGDEPRLAKVGDGVFDGILEPARLRAFLEMPGHFLIVAIDVDVVVGMTTAVRYLNPDKPPELWINEVGVAPAHRNRGVATALLGKALQIGRDLDCKQAWVLTDDANEPAKRVYSRVAESFRQSRQLLFELHLTSDRSQSPSDAVSASQRSPGTVIPVSRSS